MALVPYRPARRTVPRGTFRGLGCGCAPRLGSVPYAVRPLAVPAWQVDQGALRAAAQAIRGFGRARLGALGLSPTETTVVETAGAKAGAAAASSIAAAAGAGSVAGPIGVAVGVVIALAASLFEKNYFNVADADAACVAEEGLWAKYLTVQGHVAGRALGWPTMQNLMHAATGEGLFPGNNTHLTFHEGTLECAGDGGWVDEFLCNGKVSYSGCQNCICNVLTLYNSKRSSKPAATPDAVFFIDTLFAPLFNATAQYKWITAGMSAHPEVHQLMYDVADAYLAVNASGTVAYVEYPVVVAAAAAPAKAVAVTGPSVTGMTSGGGEEVTPETAKNAPLIAQAKTAAAAQSAATTGPSTSVHVLGTTSDTQTTAATQATAAPATTSTATTVPYTGTATAGPGLPNEEPSATGSTASAAPTAAVAAPSSGLSTTEWILILLGVGVTAYAISHSQR